MAKLQVPKILAEIIDFQTSNSVVTTPNEVVVLLCDLPELLTYTDDAGVTQVVSIPANQPMLMNYTSTVSEIISSGDLTSALNSLTGEDRYLPIVNVLPMLDSELPVAVCKVVKRNFERPKTLKDFYEAYEFAYENLENYPSGMIVPLGVSIEDKPTNSNDLQELPVFEGFGNLTTSGTLSSSVFKNINASFDFINNEFEEMYDNLKVVVKPTTDLTYGAEKLNFNIALYDTTAGEIELSNESFVPGIDLLGSEGIDTIRDYETLLAEVQTAITAGTAANISDDSLIPLIQESTIVNSISSIINSYIVVPSTFLVTPGASAIEDKTYTYTKSIAGLGTLTVTITLGSANFAVSYDETGAYTVTWSSLTDNNKVGNYVIVDQITPETWYLSDNTTFALLDSTGTAIDTPVVYSAIPTDSKKIDTTSSLDATLKQITTTSSAGTTMIDRSAFTVVKYDPNIDSRIDGTYAINFDKTKNLYTTSTLIEITGYKNTVDGEFLTINGSDYPLANANIDNTDPTKPSLIDDYVLNFNDAIEITLLKELILPVDYNFSYEITVVPNSASFSKRLVTFCKEVTADMNDCRAVMGVKPPKSTSAADIKAQVTRVTNSLSNEFYIDSTMDNGAYLSVVSGAQKINGFGGITNFPSLVVTSYSASNKTVQVGTGLSFETGDLVDLIVMKNGSNVITENKIVTVTENSSGYLLELEEELGTTFVDPAIASTRTISLTNTKDRDGSYLAAVYAVLSNNTDIDKAPFNYYLNGDNEVLYSNKQLEALIDARITPIVREPGSYNGYVKETPTFAGENSDFTDQGTIGLVMYFIRQLRKIANNKKGQRFGSTEKQLLFKTELEAPFAAQKGETIVAYELNVDFSKLNTDSSLYVSFKIREAKKLKTVSITAQLF